MEQSTSRGRETIPLSGLGVGCKLCSSSKKLHGLSVRAQARGMSIPVDGQIDGHGEQPGPAPGAIYSLFRRPGLLMTKKVLL